MASYWLLRHTDWLGWPHAHSQGACIWHLRGSAACSIAPCTFDWVSCVTKARPYYISSAEASPLCSVMGWRQQRSMQIRGCVEPP